MINLTINRMGRSKGFVIETQVSVVPNIFEADLLPSQKFDQLLDLQSGHPIPSGGSRVAQDYSIAERCLARRLSCISLL